MYDVYDVYANDLFEPLYQFWRMCSVDRKNLWTAFDLICR